MTSDIITNQNSPNLAESIQSILPSSESAKFAVGYFFLSGFNAITEYLDNVKELSIHRYNILKNLKQYSRFLTCPEK